MISSFDRSPLVSVIVPTFNRCELINDTLSSILKQSYRNIELIVIDDGSTDDTEKFVKQIKDERLRYYRIENWGGPARPRNIGVNHARGVYIAFCDDDDTWNVNKIKSQIEFIEHFKADAIYTNANIHNNNTSRTFSRMKSRKVTLGSFLKKNYLLLSSSFLRKDKLMKYEFNEDRKYIGSEDFILWIDMLTDGCKLYYDSKVYINYLNDNETSIRNSTRLSLMHYHHFKYVVRKIIEKKLNLLLIPFYVVAQISRIVKHIIIRPL